MSKKGIKLFSSLYWQISLLFIAGGILLYFVNEQKGKQEAQYLSGK